MIRLNIDGRTVRHAISQWGRTVRLCTLLISSGAALALIAQAMHG